MKPNRTTKACGRCGRHSWDVADGNPCMWCGYKSWKYESQIMLGIVIVTAAALVACIVWVVT